MIKVGRGIGDFGSAQHLILVRQNRILLGIGLGFGDDILQKSHDGVQLCLGFVVHLRQGLILRWRNRNEAQGGHGAGGQPDQGQAIPRS